MRESRRTPLHSCHLELGARMTDFGGWDMPLEYGGLASEHEAVRARAGLFDVSHMGEAYVVGPRALEFLQSVTPNDVSRLQPGRIHYTALLYENGGFVDDLLVYCEAPDRYLLVLNAANTRKDVEWLACNLLDGGVSLEDKSSETAQIAVQGPLAERILQALAAADLAGIRYYRFERTSVVGHQALVSRTGYTGEDGFEVYCDPADAVEIWEALLEEGRPQGLVPAGLAARDTLRLEARMALYGNDIDDHTTPYEADLGFIVKLDKGDFIGRGVLERQKEDGVARKLVGIEMIDRGIARNGHAVEINGREVGRVTSGTKTPTIGRAIGLAYLPIESSEIGSEFDVNIRGRRARARVVPTPFYKRAK